MRSVQKFIIAASQAEPAGAIRTSKRIPSLVSILVLGMLAGGGVSLPAQADVRADVLSSFGLKSEALPQRQVVSSAELRASPRPSGRSLVALVAGTRVELLELVGGGQWAKVRTLTEPTRVGYLRAELLEDANSGISLGRLGGQASSPREVALLHRNILEENRRAAELARHQDMQEKQARISEEKAAREREEAENKARREREDAEFREQQQQYEDQRRRQSAREWAARTAPSSGVGFPPPQQRAPTGVSRLYAPAPMADVNTERRRAIEQKQYQATSPTPGAGTTPYPSVARPAEAVSAPRPSTGSGNPSAASSSQPSQNAPTTHRPGSEPPHPQSSTSCKATYPREAICARGNSSAWYGSHGRGVAVSQAREHAKAQIFQICRSKGRYTTPRWGGSAWSEGSPECREASGYRTDGSPLLWCELDVWTTCIPSNS